MYKHILLGTLLAASMHSVCASEIRARPGDSAYLQDGRGVVVRSGTGLCWRSGYWTANDAVAGCDGELVPPVARPIAPELVPPAPERAIPQPAPAVAVRRCDFSVTLHSDETFGFNRTALNDAARRRLDRDVIDGIGNCASVEAVVVTGYADRLGSAPYNLKLSEKRAEAVAAYLGNKGVDSARILTTGAGHTQEVQACEGRLSRAQLIRCLAPNRRVVIQVSGHAK